MTGLRLPCQTRKSIIGADLATQHTDSRIEVNRPGSSPAGQMARTSTLSRAIRSTLRGLMSGLFGSPHFDDPLIGRLKRSGGIWRGKLDVGKTPNVPVNLFGSGREPDAAALAAARQLSAMFDGWRPSIQQALFDHYTPYGEAIAAEDRTAQGTKMPALQTPEQVWNHVTLQSVAVVKLGGVVTTEIVYAAAWDDDHMLGARFQGGSLVELCASV
jgi:hypothetical protein